MTDPNDRRSRDQRVRELAALPGWSLERIGEATGISKQRVHQILNQPDPEVELILQEARLQAELDDRLRHAEAHRQRIRTIRRTLARIAEEREARAIDRLLGLS